MAKFDYKTATTEEIFTHYYGASRQVIYQTKKDYEDNPVVYSKLSRAAIMVKIAKLEQEIACLKDELGALEIEIICEGLRS